jgi:hypothetical protein
MNLCLRVCLALLCFWSYASPCAAQCGFAIVPAAEQRWYRDEGWLIPGLSDAKGFADMHRTVDGKPQDWVWPEGVTAHIAVHDHDYDVQFPDAVFDDGGSNKRMLSRKFLLYRMLRWEVNGKPYAYSYLLGPHDVACTSSVDIVDDRGDGKFRLMISPGHLLIGPIGREPSPPPIPEWLQQPKS